MHAPEKKKYYEHLAHEVMTKLGTVPHEDLIQRLLASVIRMSGDARRADLKIAAAALEEMEHSFDVLELFSRRRKVSIFGSARSGEDTPIYQQAFDFAQEITQRGFMVITGAGPGVMAAGNHGAGRENSFGLGIRLPHEFGSNPYISGDIKDIHFKYFFTRKLAFLKDSHAVLLCPGGYGTHDEGFETLTLMQTGKAQLLPLVCLAPEENPFWENWDRYIRDTLLTQGMISDADLSLYKVTHSVDEACDEVCNFYKRYHSSRFCDGDLVVRLTSSISDDELEELNENFADIVASGRIVRSESPQGEDFDSRLETLPSLSFRFIYGRYGRLRQLIDAINDCQGEFPDIPPEQGEGGRLHAEMDEGGKVPEPGA
jgi:uncharacterized protein (TIGR00730 family)